MCTNISSYIWKDCANYKRQYSIKYCNNLKKQKYATEIWNKQYNTNHGDKVKEQKKMHRYFKILDTRYARKDCANCVLLKNGTILTTLSQFKEILIEINNHCDKVKNMHRYFKILDTRYARKDCANQILLKNRYNINHCNNLKKQRDPTNKRYNTNQYCDEVMKPEKRKKNKRVCTNVACDLRQRQQNKGLRRHEGDDNSSESGVIVPSRRTELAISFGSYPAGWAAEKHRKSVAPWERSSPNERLYRCRCWEPELSVCERLTRHR